MRRRKLLSHIHPLHMSVGVLASTWAWECGVSSRLRDVGFTHACIHRAGRKPYVGFTDCVRRILHEEGPMAFYRVCFFVALPEPLFVRCSRPMELMMLFPV